MPTLSELREEEASFVVVLDRALGRLLSPLVDLVPRRLRRIAEKIERQRKRTGLIAASGFLLVTAFYGLVVGGEIGRIGDSILVFAGFGIEDVKITGDKETSEIAILEKLEPAGSLISFDVGAAQKRVSELPWVEHATVRKFYPGTLKVEITERKPFALWQRKDGEVLVIDKTGTGIEPLTESRFARLPFMVGGGANSDAALFLADLLSAPKIAAEMHAAVLVSGRRWDLHLENGVTVKLPEKHVREALAELVKLDDEKQLLARDVIVIDLRLPDRVTVRLPEGRSLEDVISEEKNSAQGRSRT